MSTHEQLIESAPHDLMIAGSWVGAENGHRFCVANPATSETLTTVADASPGDGVRALDAAFSAADAWAAMSPRNRSDILLRTFDLLIARADELALLITLEMGKPLAEARAEVTYGAEFLRWFSAEAVRVAGRYMPHPEGTGQMVVSHEPVGPCYLITPWNFPLAMVTRKVAPALAAGCTVVVKPAELTPLTALLLAELFAEAGLPPGVMNVITTTRARDVSTRILLDPRLRKLSFTGSTSVGKSLLAQAAVNVLRVSMELGGNAPLIVFADADLETAVEGAVAAKFRNMGQACTAANRLLVDSAIAPEFTERLAHRIGRLKTGPGTEDGVEIGPLIDERAVSKTERLIADSVALGAKVEIGGKRMSGPGSFFEPTLVTGVSRDSALCREEIFGPVVSISSFVDEDEAVSIANETEYGLASYVFTESLPRAHRLIGSLKTGMMGVNTGVISSASAPFGGRKHSGFGREGGLEGIHEYLSSKYTLFSN